MYRDTDNNDEFHKKFPEVEIVGWGPNSARTFTSKKPLTKVDDFKGQLFRMPGNPKAFMDEVMEERLPNPFMPYNPWRIATDTSQKVGIRFGETIKSYLAQNRDLDELAGPGAVRTTLHKHLS